MNASIVSPAMVQAAAKPMDSVAEAQAYTAEMLARLGPDAIAALESQFPYVDARPGWTNRWCNDEKDNIPRRLADGWRFVRKQGVPLDKKNTDMGDAVSISTSTGGGPIRAILMEIPTELAEKILDARSYSKVRAIEAAIVGGALGSQEGRYIPGNERDSAFFGTRNKVTRAASPT